MTVWVIWSDGSDDSIELKNRNDIKNNRKILEKLFSSKMTAEQAKSNAEILSDLIPGENRINNYITAITYKDYKISVRTC